MNIKTKLDPTIILLLVIILAGVVELVVVGRKIVGMSGEIDGVYLDIQEEYARREKYEDLIADYNEIASENISQTLAEALPTTDNFVQVIEELETLAGLSGNQIVMTLGETKLTNQGFEIDENNIRNRSTSGFVLPEDASYDFIEIEITLRGSYAQFLNFLHLFQHSKYYMNIVSTKINRVATQPAAYIDASLTIEVFVQKVIYPVGTI